MIINVFMLLQIKNHMPFAPIQQDGMENAIIVYSKNINSLQKKLAKENMDMKGN